MENKEVEVKEVKEYKININYINFIEEVIKNKIISKEELKNKYNEIVSLRVNNIKRVDRRNKRKEVKEVLIGVLKSKNIDIKEYNKVSKEVLEKFNKRSNNYIVVKN